MAALTEEQSLIRDQAKSWAGAEAPVQKFREMRDAATEQRYTPATWQSMVEMGWTGILIPEEYGGSNLGFLTFGVVLEELGRQLTASPLFASALVGASAVLLGGNREQQQALLPGIVDGSEILTLAVDESPRHAPLQTTLQATSTEAGFVLNGHKTFVLEGLAATQLVVVARTAGAPGDADGLSLLLVPTAAAGVNRDALSTVDSRGYANISFTDVEVPSAALLGELNDGYALLQPLLDRAVAGLSADMLGTAAQAFDMTLEYLKTREQFGRVIGSFQALGHRAATLYSGLELSRSCAEAALQALDAQSDDTPQLCALAKCKVGDYLHEMSNQLIQIHGGIGMTDEFDAGFYLKRARVLAATYGNQAFHRDRYATLLGF
ncbi:MAG: acyl-CoA dehydrogenase family protein [Pseudomonadota bacterium]